MHRHIKPFITLFACIVAISCNQHVEEPPVPEKNGPLNSFKMALNDTEWTPSVISSCRQTFTCSLSKLNDVPYYNIDAYRDPTARYPRAENVFKIQLMNADRVGTYAINGSFENFESYVMYKVSSSSGTKTYQNKINGNAFHVEITGFLPQENFGDGWPGIKGSFSGTLYNKDNALDSLQIDNGSFVFQKTNRYDFDQCKD